MLELDDSTVFYLVPETLLQAANAYQETRSKYAPKPIDPDDADRIVDVLYDVLPEDVAIPNRTAQTKAASLLLQTYDAETVITKIYQLSGEGERVTSLRYVIQRLKMEAKGYKGKPKGRPAAPN